MDAETDEAEREEEGRLRFEGGGSRRELLVMGIMRGYERRVVVVVGREKEGAVVWSFGERQGEGEGSAGWRD